MVGAVKVEKMSQNLLENFYEFFWDRIMRDSSSPVACGDNKNNEQTSQP